MFKAQSAQSSSQDALDAASLTLSNAREAADETLAYGRAAAKAARKSGQRGAIGSILGGIGSVGMGSYQVWGK